MYIACALFVAIFPNLSADLVGWLTHSDSIERSITLGGTVAGLIEVVIYIYIAARLFAWAFNKSVSK
ncbi:MAG: hypothetical protein Athens071426_187 [Parcubacteria group bacterium Athens0714_26]|nr:MAG: hypothetical protein Athens101426_413 [Parcubacteria group bacterium Athens1014_26]TSD03590.1 MAG: hypothetical protein Athens071426_187 [Parcubacteria group bacterium Athens0714_26]